MAPFLSSMRSPKSPKSPGRSRFSKALPATPPVFDKLFSSSSTSIAAPTYNAPPELPPLPPPSSNLLDTTSYSFVPAYGSAPGESAAPSTTQAYSTAATPGYSGHTNQSIPRRPMPGTLASLASPASSTTSVSSATLPLPSLPVVQRPVAKQLPPQPPLPPLEKVQSPPARPIRRRPVASHSSSIGATTTTAPTVPDKRPNGGFSSFATTPTAHQRSDVSATAAPRVDLPELPALPDFDLSPHQQPAGEPSPPPRKPSPDAASISSILSAYSQSSSQPVGRSSASDGTYSTVQSSYLAASSPPPAASKTGGLLTPSQSPGAQEDEILTPLSYLLEEEYGDDDADRETTEEELYRHYGPYDAQDGRVSLIAPSTAAAATGSKPEQKTPQTAQTKQTQTNTLPPPRSTSLRGPAIDNKPLPQVGAKELPAAPVPAPADTPSQLWRRRSQKVDGGLSLPGLDLSLVSTSTAVSGSTFPSSNTGEPQQKRRPSYPQDHNTLPNQPALPPPLSPLPPPPARAHLDQLHSPSRTPLIPGSPSVSSPRIGLPGRDIRPFRQQASPALLPSVATPAIPPATVPAAAPATAPATAPIPLPTRSPARSPATVSPPSTAPLTAPLPAAPEPSTTSPVADVAVASADSTTTSPVTHAFSKMGHSFSHFEAKVENRLKRKEKNKPKDVSASPSPQLPTPPKEAALPLPPIQRLPTPEYDDSQGKANGSAFALHGHADTLSPGARAPVSPAASPAPTLGRAENTRVSPVSSPPPAGSGFRPALPGRDIRPAKNVSPVHAAPPQLQQQQQQFAPRTSSRKVSFSTPRPREQYHATEEDATVSEAGSQMTIKAVPPPLRQQQSTPVMASKPILGEAHSNDQNVDDLPLAPGMPPAFPSGYMSPKAPDTVFAAPPPGPVQYYCLHRHREMFRDRNVNYPLSCQACQTFERSLRWRCKFCYLRICTGCRIALQSDAFDGNLEQLMTQLTERGREAVHQEAFAAAEEAYGPTRQGTPMGSELPMIRER